MYSVGFGLLTLTIVNNNPNPDKNLTLSAGDINMAVEAISSDAGSDGESTNENSRLNVTMDSESVLETTPALSSVPTIAPTPTPLLVYELEKNTIPEIDELFINYFKAMSNRDLDTLQKLVTDADLLMTKDELKNEMAYIDDYSDIQCYTKKSYLKDTYIVCVYYEVEYFNIKTPGPALSMYYVIKDEDGSYKKSNGVLEDELDAYLSERNSDADIQSLVTKTLAKVEKAKDEDKDLAAFWKNAAAVDDTTKEADKE